jgi:PemK-like, MazF-like toxin of type II toxin-antitoxin system
MARGSWRDTLGRLVSVVVREGTRAAREDRPAPARRLRRSGVPAPARNTTPTGVLDLDYAPRDDGKPDPGEIVWAWVPFEEGDGRGKDRPVLVVGRDGTALLALMLSSKDHDPDAADEARHGRHWVDVGSGPWDRQGRPSEVRVDRVLRIDPSGVRREGAALDRARFEEVAAEVRRSRG